MQHLPIWFLGEVPADACASAIADFSKLPKRDATMGSDGSFVAHGHRNTDVRFAETGHWLSKLMDFHARTANDECKWGYEVDTCENVQFAQYDVGQHYEWHVDTFTLSGKPKDRKLTVVILLNDPSEYQGGEFQIRLYQQYTAPLKKGSMIAFPSILEHRVTPVTEGVRMSATMWLSGPRFK